MRVDYYGIRVVLMSREHDQAALTYLWKDDNPIWVDDRSDRLAFYKAYRTRIKETGSATAVTKSPPYWIFQPAYPRSLTIWVMMKPPIPRNMMVSHLYRHRRTYTEYEDQWVVTTRTRRSLRPLRSRGTQSGTRRVVRQTNDLTDDLTRELLDAPAFALMRRCVRRFIWKKRAREWCLVAKLKRWLSRNARLLNQQSYWPPGPTLPRGGYRYQKAMKRFNPRK